MAAALLTDEPVKLRNLPRVRDIQTTGRLLQEMGLPGRPGEPAKGPRL